MKAQNGGMLGVNRAGERGSCAILTQNFPGGAGVQGQKRKEPRIWRFIGRDLRGRSGGAHSFLAEKCSERPGAVKGAPGARAQRPLTARPALRKFPREGMTPLPTRSHEQIFQPIGGQSR